MTMPSPYDTPTTTDTPTPLIAPEEHPLGIEPIERSGELTIYEFGVILDATLKPRHRKNQAVLRFMDSFVRCKSISQASYEAGIRPEMGYKFRHRVDIANAIQKVWDKSAMKYGCDTSEIFERVKEVTEFDPIELQNPDGTYKSNLHDIRPEARRNLKELVVKNLYNQTEDMNGIKSKIIIGQLISYKFYDKLKAAELIGKEKEMFKSTTKVEHSLTKDMQSILLDSAKRGQERRLVEDTNTIDITPTGQS